ncbi:hypothetical protein [Virgibacillus ndiopensis]|uniref:hypothetical protein n=1 Tax=Virgibacillus ndiopensis TaxID=2004408 RepID=UPI000C07067B|nr:hypothetical protein [Virgibacillus ndiopensis]
MRKLDIGFAVAGSIMTIIFLVLVNFLTGSDDWWFIYPSTALLLWPIGMYCVKKKKQKLLSVCYSALIIMYLIFENYTSTPNHPWFLYAVYPIIWWPILMILGKRAKEMSVALVGSISIILYYVVLNINLSPYYPWAIYPTFVILWWPISLYHAKRRSDVMFSIHATILISVFFISVNAVSTPDTIWAVYPIFGVLWWPLSMYYFVYKRKFKS